MTKKITIVTGSVRPNSVGDKLLPLVEAELKKHEGVEVRVANLKELNLPFVDSETIPAAEGFAPTHESVKEWQKIVQDSDGVVLLTPEYNNQISAVQKNAIDWLYEDWKDKKISIVGYSWSGAEPVIELLERLIKKVGAVSTGAPAKLRFKQEVDLYGTILDQKAVDEQIHEMVKNLIS